MPITIVTLGFFLLVVNAGMVVLVAAHLPGFHIFGDFWSAFGTALIVCITVGSGDEAARDVLVVLDLPFIFIVIIIPSGCYCICMTPE